MKIGVWTKMFGQVAKDVFFGEARFWRRKQIGAIFEGNHPKWLVLKCLHFAEEHRNMGYKITDERVWDIMKSKDSFYCGNLTPLKFAARSWEEAQVALVAVRETIREDLGIALPRMSIKQLKTSYRNGTLYE